MDVEFQDAQEDPGHEGPGLEPGTVNDPIDLSSDDESQIDDLTSSRSVFSISSDEAPRPSRVILAPRVPPVLDTDAIMNDQEDQGETVQQTFGRFVQFPIEVRLNIWEQAYPELGTGRVINLIYDPAEDRFHSYNSSNSILLYIHRESRDWILKTHKLCFGTETHEPRIYFDFHKDIMLPDDYLQYNGPMTRIENEDDREDGYHGKPTTFDCWPLGRGEERGIERLAINSSFFAEIMDLFSDIVANSTVTSKQRKLLIEDLRPIVARFESLREINFVIEDINPFERGPIQLFNIRTKTCSPICKVCYHARMIQSSVTTLRDVFGKMQGLGIKLDIKAVGAYRGCEITELGCYANAVDATDYDDPFDRPEPYYLTYGDGWVPAAGGIWNPTLSYHNPPAFGSESDDDEDYSTHPENGDIENEHSRYLKYEKFRPYEYGDVKETFSDHSDEENASEISLEEVQDLCKDEDLYKTLLGESGEHQYIDMQDEWIHAEYYEMRMEL